MSMPMQLGLGVEDISMDWKSIQIMGVVKLSRDVSSFLKDQDCFSLYSCDDKIGASMGGAAPLGRG
ncbi:hypothetical protein Leryth_012281, partial [Lithospermum erythrorhizon]